MGEEPSVPPVAADAKDGLIGREPNPADARSTLGCLLPVGRAAVEKVAPGHVADVRRNFIDLLTSAELDLLATLNERILQHLATTTTPPQKKTSARNRRARAYGDLLPGCIPQA